MNGGGFKDGQGAGPGPKDTDSKAIAGAPGELADATVTQLLALGVSRQQRPVDRLIERLAAPDGPGWFDLQTRTPTMSAGGDPAAGLARGAWGLVQVDRFKDTCKLKALTDPDTSARLTALAAYFIAIASAIVHHRRLITSQPPKELEEVLAELAGVTPEPWSGLFAQAVVELNSVGRS